MRLGLIQLCSTLDSEANLKKIRYFLEEARAKSLEAVFLPEVFYSYPEGNKGPADLVTKGNSHFEKIRSLAREYSLALLGGSVCYEEEGKLFNRSLNFSSQGEDLGFYDKIHLFRCDLPQLQIDEGELFTPGKNPSLIQLGELKIGLSICFDLRFPDLYQYYKSEGAHLLSISSAFTGPTGRAGHWTTLVRARAIETQSFVVACNQWGKNNAETETYGHSLIVDPWGEILADAAEGEKLIYADIDLEKVNLVRRKVILS